MRPYRVFFVTLLLASLLAGCSALRIGYANGDTFVYWWLDSYVDFTDTQKPWVRAHIDQLFAWHRKTQLNDYAQLLAQVRQRVQQGRVTPAEVLADIDAVKKRTALVLDKAAPQLADLVVSLTPDQLAHLEKKFAANNDKYRNEYLHGSLADRQRHRYKQVMKNAEYWFGDFSKEQEARIRALSDARPLNNELWLAERMRRQQEMLRMLRKIHAEKPSREAAVAMLREFTARSLENFTYEENKALFDANLEGLAQTVALIINITTPEQRARADKRLQRLIEDSHALAVKD
jgi:hypothetical protein